MIRIGTSETFDGVPLPVEGAFEHLGCDAVAVPAAYRLPVVILKVNISGEVDRISAVVFRQHIFREVGQASSTLDFSDITANYGAV